MKGIFLLLDGAGENPLPQLGGKTPLDWSAGPVMARLRREGTEFSLQTCPQGYLPDSLVCILTLFGVPKEEIPSGRGALEALAAGCPLAPQDAYYRCNFPQVDGEGRVVSAAGNLSAEIREQLARSLSHVGDGIQYFPLQDYRALVRVPHAKGIAPLMPPHRHLGERLTLPKDPQLTQFYQAAWQTLSRLGVKDHQPALWDGAFPQEFSGKKRFSGRWGAVCGAEIARGIALSLGMETPVIPGATGDTDTSLREKCQAAKELLLTKDWVFVHVNGADEAAHRKNPREKWEFLARVERELTAPLLEFLPQDGILWMTGDHNTSSRSGKHEPGLQKAVLWQKGRDLSQFHPKECWNLPHLGGI